ncbi:MAG: hypothetical protein LBP72_08075 [Dysgonamonadaceae bacterium]|jgi:hypothetical protein|nr:hypothetical protein [Dysgonamonadaceae bacterium]
MPIKTIAQLRTVANVIKNETEDGANTAGRVGGEFLDIVDTFANLSFDGGGGGGEQPALPIAIMTELAYEELEEIDENTLYFLT